MDMRAVMPALELGACPVQSAAGLQPVPSVKSSSVF